jgi:UDP-N-acetylglucosamine 2-epimerase (non-hydrolysing)
MKKILFIFGTRPEAIKLAPLIKEFQSDSKNFKTLICVTAQHREMLDQVLNFFGIKPDYDLNMMKLNQTFFDFSSSESFKKIGTIIDKHRPDLIFVQGDTTTAFLASLAGYYKKVKIAHVEAGLRSYDKYSPFPEEVHRKLIDHLADYYFAATKSAKQNLLKEGIKKNVWVVGNTVIDALYLGLKTIENESEKKYLDYFKFIDFSKKLILVTTHRRENFGQPLKNIAEALKIIAAKYKNIEIIFPVHPNPNVKTPIYNILDKVPNIHLVNPLDYPHLIWIMNKSYFIMTDSGGIQEEAPSLGKPVLVLRIVTERTEGIKAGSAKLVGTDKNKIVSSVKNLLINKQTHQKMSKALNPYGNGKSCKKIVRIIQKII